MLVFICSILFLKIFKVSATMNSFRKILSSSGAVNNYKVLSKVGITKYGLISKNFFKNLSFDDQDAVLTYTYRSRDINRFLSGGSHIKQVFYKDVSKIVTTLDEVVKKFKLEDDILVFKGANRKYFEDLKVGHIFNPKYFFSTSVDQSVAEEFLKNKRNSPNPLMIKVRVPKESKAMYVGEESGWKNHKEIILARDTSYKVLKFDNDNLELEVIVNKE